MQSIRENQLIRIKKKGQFLREMGIMPPYIESNIEAVTNLETAESVGKETRDKNWPKVELIEKIFDAILTSAKFGMTREGCEECGKCDDKVKIIDELLGIIDNPTDVNLENLTPVGEC